MARRTIRDHADPLLRKKSKTVKLYGNRLHTLLDDMLETMRSVNGMGLAAPQVGSLKRAFIIEYEDKLYELINPEIVETTGTQSQREACLSVPGKNGIVARPSYVKLKGRDRHGEEITVEGEEMFAVALCHELDHLDGILYTDKAIELYDNEPEEEEEANNDE
jgi:peptide deformylase